MKINFLLDVLFPRACVVCEKKIEDGAICADCAAIIPAHKTLFCPGCGTGMRGDRSLWCRCKKDYLLGAAGPYDNPALRALIHALKFNFIKDAALPLAGLLSSYIANTGVDLTGYTVIPVPLSRKRERGRGFNQAERIATIFAEHQSLPIDTSLLFRKEHRKPQSETKNIRERQENIRGCYAVRERPSLGQVPHSVLLIDDVTTSGATFREAGGVLRSAGVQDIFALAVAKA